MGRQRTRNRSWMSSALALAYVVACGAAHGPRHNTTRPPGSSGTGQAGAAEPSEGGASASEATGGQGGHVDVPGAAAGASDAQRAGGAAGETDTKASAGMAGASEPVHWSGSIGSLCGANDQTSLWLVMSPERESCETRSTELSVDRSDFIRAELPGSSDTDVLGVSTVAATYCSNGRCGDGTLALTLNPDSAGMSGKFSLAVSGTPIVAGTLATARCAWDDFVPSAAPAAPGVRGLALQGLAVFQAVKVPIMELGLALAAGRANVVAGKSALFRAYVEPAANWSPRPVRAKLTLVNGEQTTFFEDTASPTQASDDATLDSTFDFAVPGDEVRADTQYALELFETAACAATGVPSPGRFPEAGTVTLGAEDVGGVDIELVPVRIRNLAGDLLPDTSDAQIALLRNLLVNLFPISDAVVHLRPTPLDSTATTTLEVLDDVSALRDSEAPDRRLTYYGLFQLTDTLDEYCSGPCVLGAGIVGDGTNPEGGTAVGVGYTGDAAARTFAHELGHVYGRQHSPCNTPGDPDYPYSDGRTGVWGYDASSRALMPPTYSDIMGYCQPFWVSDYVFGHLATFIAAVNADVQLSYVGEAARFRTILLERGQPPRFGRSHTFTGLPPGKPEPALAYTARGSASRFVAYRAEVGDVDAALVYVPDPAQRNWSSVRLAGAPIVEFNASASAVAR